MHLLPYELSIITTCIAAHSGRPEHTAQHATPTFSVLRDADLYCEHFGFKLVGPEANGERAFLERIDEDGNQRLEIISPEIPQHQAWAFQTRAELEGAAAVLLKRAHAGCSFEEVADMRVLSPTMFAMMIQVCTRDGKPLGRRFQLIWRETYFYKDVFAQ